jgi:pimeloyl-ACP methyl ester carboxylesterase
VSSIFVFTAGGQAARQHLADSIEHPIPDETVFANFGEPHHGELKRIREEGNGFYAWGALPGPGNRRTWDAMERDDRVLCVYDNAYRYTARVLAKYNNPDLSYFNEVDRGGHFAAWEEPELFSEEIRVAFRSLR